MAQTAATPQLRGSPTPPAAAASPAPRRPDPTAAQTLFLRRPLGRAPDVALMSPSLALPDVPRLDGRIQAFGPGGGAQCRTRCAQENYACAGGGDAGDHCSQAWSKCVLACPDASGEAF